MSQLDPIRRYINETWPSAEPRELTLSIVDYLERTPAPQLRVLTLQNLCAAVGKAKVDTAVVAAVHLLSNTSIELLEPHLFYVDDDENDVELSEEDMREALSEGQFVHPTSGHTVSTSSERLIPFFSATPKLLALKSAGE